MATYSREYLAAQARQGWKGLTLSKKQEAAARAAGYGKSLEAAYSSGRARRATPTPTPTPTQHRATPTQHIMPYPDVATPISAGAYMAPQPTTPGPTPAPEPKAADGVPILPLLIAAAAIVVAVVMK
ncbi:MAG: hypothetical protein ACXQS4_00655 [Methermicoccaceae archaeon]